MILVKLPAIATCDESGCSETVPCDLLLLENGTLGPHPKASGWVLGHIDTYGTGMPTGSRCPAHRRSYTEAKP